MANQFVFPRRPAKKIDARATRLDIAGNVTSSPGEKAFTGMHLGMDGRPISGRNILTGAVVNFPQGRDGQTAALAANPSPAAAHDDLNTRGPAPNATAQGVFPQRSRMTTGDPTVTFQGPAERLAAMQAQAAANAEAMKMATGAVPNGSSNALQSVRAAGSAAGAAMLGGPAAAMLSAMGGATPNADAMRSVFETARQKEKQRLANANAGVVRQEGGATGGVVLDKGTATPSLLSVYGSGSARPATIEEASGDLQNKWAQQGGPGRVADETGDRTAAAQSGFPQRKPEETADAEPDADEDDQSTFPKRKKTAALY